MDFLNINYIFVNSIFDLLNNNWLYKNNAAIYLNIYKGSRFKPSVFCSKCQMFMNSIEYLNVT